MKRVRCQISGRGDELSHRAWSGQGKKVYTLKTVEAEEGGVSERCAQNNGFSLYADVSCEVNERKKLELKKAFRNGITHVVMSPLELLQKLAALVPRSRLNLIRLTNRMF